MAAGERIGDLGNFIGSVMDNTPPEVLEAKRKAAEALVEDALNAKAEVAAMEALMREEKETARDSLNEHISEEQRKAGHWEATGEVDERYKVHREAGGFHAAREDIETRAIELNGDVVYYPEARIDIEGRLVITAGLQEHHVVASQLVFAQPFELEFVPDLTE